MLREEVGGAREVPASGENVRELLDDLMSRFPAPPRAARPRRRDRAVRQRLRRGRGRADARRPRHSGRAWPDGHPASGDGRRLRHGPASSTRTGPASPRSILGSARASNPRGKDWLFELFASLGPKPGTSSSTSARATDEAITLARTHELRAVALDPVPLHCERARRAVAEAGLEDRMKSSRERSKRSRSTMRGSTGSGARDMLVHVDLERGLSECAASSSRAAAMVAYVTLATDQLEPRERA